MADPMTEMSDQGLVISAGRQMPSPRTIAAVLKDQLNAAVLGERRRRGQVVSEEDTFPMQRSLAKVVETCGEYARAFQTAGKEAKAVAEEELIDAVGEQDGMPLSGLLVPDAEGDVRISLDTSNDYDIDLESLISASVFLTLETNRDQVEGLTECEAEPETKAQLDVLADLLDTAMRGLISLGSFKPQVSKVKAFKAELARLPEADGVASTVVVRKKVNYRGVKIERKQT